MPQVPMMNRCFFDVVTFSSPFVFLASVNDGVVHKGVPLQAISGPSLSRQASRTPGEPIHTYFSTVAWCRHQARNNIQPDNLWCPFSSGKEIRTPDLRQLLPYPEMTCFRDLSRHLPTRSLAAAISHRLQCLVGHSPSTFPHRCLDKVQQSILGKSYVRNPLRSGDRHMTRQLHSNPCRCESSCS